MRGESALKTAGRKEGNCDIHGGWSFEVNINRFHLKLIRYIYL